MYVYVCSVPVFVMLDKLVLNVTCTNCHNKKLQQQTMQLIKIIY